MAATGVVVRPSYNPLQFVFAACTPYAIVDGATYTLMWGANFIPLPPGQHAIRVYTVYLMWPQCGAADATFTTEEGHTPTIKWRAPSVTFLRGGIRMYPDTPPEHIPPYATLPGRGWAPMPSGAPDPAILPGSAVSAAPAPAPPAATAAAPVCARCGAVAEPGTRYCRECGSFLEA